MSKKCCNQTRESNDVYIEIKYDCQIEEEASAEDIKCCHCTCKDCEVEQSDQSINATEEQCDQSLNGTEEQCNQSVNGTEAQCDQSINGTEAQCDQSINGTEAQCDQSIKETEAQCDQSIKETEAQYDQSINGTEAQCDQSINGTEAQCDQPIIIIIINNETLEDIEEGMCTCLKKKQSDYSCRTDQKPKCADELPLESTSCSGHCVEINVIDECALDLNDQKTKLDGKNLQNKKFAVMPDDKLDWTPIKNSNAPIVWLLGRPGTGKDTQAQNIVSYMPGFVHISTGDLLRSEVEKGTHRGRLIEAIMKQGGLAPNEIVQELLNIKMLAELPHARAFLIDGYPREKQQADEFVRDAKPPKRILYLDAPDDVIIDRLNKRGKTSGRADDNEDSVRRRLEQAKINDAPILTAYQNEISTINTNKTLAAVFPAVIEALKDVYPHVEFSV